MTTGAEGNITPDDAPRSTDVRLPTSGGLITGQINFDERASRQSSFRTGMTWVLVVELSTVIDAWLNLTIPFVSAMSADALTYCVIRPTLGKARLPRTSDSWAERGARKRTKTRA